MEGVLYQVLELLRQGKTVQGSIELPDSLVLWDLDYDGVCIKFKARDYLGLDDQIQLTGLGRQLIEGPAPLDDP